MSLIFIITKYLAFIALSGISMLLSYNMFSQLSKVPVESLLLSIVAIAIEALKIFSLVRGNTLLQIKMKKQAIRAYAMYGILAILAVLASYGYTLTVVDRGIRTAEQSEVQFQIDANRMELEIIEEQIESLETQIDAAVVRQGETPYDFITAWRNITDQINQLEDQKAEFITRRLELNTEYAGLRTDLAREQTQTQSTVDMFRLMAESFGMSETFLMLALLLTIAILIELGIVSTSPTIPIDKKHMTHILNEFAHNLHLDELEAERALERAKRQQEVHKMYEEAGLQDPNEWPLIDRRHPETDTPPEENLRKLMKDPSDPTLPDDTHSMAHTPEPSPHADDPSFLNAFKTVLFKRSYEPEEVIEDKTNPEPELEPEVAPEHINLPVRQIHHAPAEPEKTEVAAEDDTIALTADELEDIVKDAEIEVEAGKPEVLEDEIIEEVVEEPVAEPEPVEEPKEEAVPEETVQEQPEEPAPVVRRTRKTTKKKEEPEPEPERTDEPAADEEPPKPRRRTRSKPKKAEVREEAPDTSEAEASTDVEPANWSSTAAPKVAAPITPIREKKEVAPDDSNELHVRSIKPQEVGETKTYRFGKTTMEVKKLFITFIDGLFKENGEEFLVDPSVASRESRIKPALGTIFIKRLQELKGTTGLALIEQRDDGFYYPNYTKEYIISYTTKEVNTQGRAV